MALRACRKPLAWHASRMVVPPRRLSCAPHAGAEKCSLPASSTTSSLASPVCGSQNSAFSRPAGCVQRPAPAQLTVTRSYGPVSRMRSSPSSANSTRTRGVARAPLLPQVGGIHVPRSAPTSSESVHLVPDRPPLLRSAPSRLAKEPPRRPVPSRLAKDLGSGRRGEISGPSTMADIEKKNFTSLAREKKKSKVRPAHVHISSKVSTYTSTSLYLLLPSAPRNLPTNALPSLGRPRGRRAGSEMVVRRQSTGEGAAQGREIAAGVSESKRASQQRSSLIADTAEVLM